MCRADEKFIKIGTTNKVKSLRKCIFNRYVDSHNKHVSVCILFVTAKRFILSTRHGLPKSALATFGNISYIWFITVEQQFYSCYKTVL